MNTMILRIQKKSPGYLVQLLELDPSTGDEVSSIEEDLPADLDGLAETPALAESGSGAAEVRDLRPNPLSGEEGRSSKLAKQLYGLVFRGKVGEAWHRLAGIEPLKPGVAWRLILDIQPGELRRYPWESMGPDPFSNAVYPACSPACSMIRGPIDFKASTKNSDPPIKFLIVVGSSPADDVRVKAAEELDLLENTFVELRHLVDYQKLIRPNRAALAEMMKTYKPHVFHFIGHGQLDEHTQPFLYLYDEATGVNKPWTLSDMIKDFGKYPPDFVFLNACHAVDSTKEVGLWSISDLFYRLGARGVLGTLGAVRGAAAANLARVLYRALTAGQSLDLALTEARCGVDQLTDAEKWDWALPYLRLTVLPERVLPIAWVVPPPVRDRIGKIRKFVDNSSFVDREDERQTMLAKFKLNADEKSRLVLVRGVEKVGKTRLITYCLEASLLWGYHVKYVDLTGENSVNELGVLYEICDGADDDLLAGKLPENAFPQFISELTAQLSGPGPPAAGAQPLTWKDLREKFPRFSGDGHEKQVEKVFQCFVEDLSKVVIHLSKAGAGNGNADGDPTADGPSGTDRSALILVLDEITSTSQGGIRPDLFQQYIRDRLIQPINDQKVQGIVLVLAVDLEESKRLGLDTLDPIPAQINLDLFQPKQYQKLAELYMRRRNANQLLISHNKNPGILQKRIAFTTEELIDLDQRWTFEKFEELDRMYIRPYTK